MTLQTIPGQGLFYPTFPFHQSGGLAFNSHNLSAATHKAAFLGRVWNKDRTNKSIHKVGFRAGAITSAGGTTLRVSLQDVSLTTGAAGQPDGTQDQTVDTLLSALTANGWNQLGVLSADRAVNYMELVAVVFEFTGYGGADALAVTGLATNLRLMLATTLLNTAAWTPQNTLPDVILEFSDGTFGTLLGAFPCSDVNSLAYNTGSVPDENALEFQLPHPCKLDSLGALCQISAAGDCSLVLYDGTTALATCAIDGNTVSDNGTGRFAWTPIGDGTSGNKEVTLAANHTYRVAFRPDTATNVTLYYVDVAAAGHFQAHGFGSAAFLNSRTDAGAWGAGTATRRPMIFIGLSALDDGAGAGSSYPRPMAAGT